MSLVHLSCLCTLFAPPSLAPTAAPALAQDSHSEAVAQEPEFRILTLSNSDAHQLAKLLTTTLRPGERVSPDPRTNSILVQAPPKRFERITQLASELDRPRPVAAGGAASEHSGRQQADDDPFEAVESDLVIEMGGDATPPSLWRLAQQYARVTGQQLVVNPETKVQLESQPVPLTESINVPAASAQTFVESILLASNVVMIPMLSTEPPLVRLVSTNTNEFRSVGPMAWNLQAQEALDFCRRHPAVLVQTTVTMKSDVRQLANSLRAMTPDLNRLMFVPGGDTSTLVVSGVAGTVASMLVTLFDIDAATAEQPAGPERGPQGGKQGGAQGATQG